MIIEFFPLSLCDSFADALEGRLNMSEQYSIKQRIKDIINGEVDYEKQRKASIQGFIDRADQIYQFLLALFILGFVIVMLIKYFL